MLKPLAPKFRPDLCASLKDIAEKQVPVKLKPKVGSKNAPPFASTRREQFAAFFLLSSMTLSFETPPLHCRRWKNTENGRGLKRNV